MPSPKKAVPDNQRTLTGFLPSGRPGASSGQAKTGSGWEAPKQPRPQPPAAPAQASGFGAGPDRGLRRPPSGAAAGPTPAVGSVYPVGTEPPSDPTSGWGQAHGPPRVGEGHQSLPAGRPERPGGQEGWGWEGAGGEAGARPAAVPDPLRDRHSAGPEPARAPGASASIWQDDSDDLGDIEIWEAEGGVGGGGSGWQRVAGGPEGSGTSAAGGAAAAGAGGSTTAVVGTSAGAAAAAAAAERWGLPRPVSNAAGPSGCAGGDAAPRATLGAVPLLGPDPAEEGEDELVESSAGIKSRVSR